MFVSTETAINRYRAAHPDVSEAYARRVANFAAERGEVFNVETNDWEPVR